MCSASRRDVGLGMVERLPGLKRRLFIREATADSLVGDVPKLLRGNIGASSVTGARITALSPSA